MTTLLPLSPNLFAKTPSDVECIVREQIGGEGAVIAAAAAVTCTAAIAFRKVAYLALCLILLPTCALVADDISPQQFEYFEKHVRPLLTQRCLKCHAAESEEIGGNLYLDSRSGWSRGGDLGPAIIPGQPDQSLLIQAVRRTHEEVQMPPDEKLPDSEIRVFKQWIAMGAPDPRVGVESPTKSRIDLEQGREHWAFQSPHGKRHPVPFVRDAGWPENSIDFFVLAKLERQHLSPASRTDRQTLIRRATFDLTGLPPTPDEIDAFQHDHSPNAFEKLVDRLLASPRYGERWGRFWLDVARYADSNGLDENIAHGNAWRYRDYVIAAFNRDKPYDEFVLEQLAGDLLPPSVHEAVNHERTIATGFLSLGPKVLAEVDETKMEMDIIDEQVETVGRAFMALTLGCARCHDHKFDPISTEDYYALAGIFKSTKTMEHFTKIARWREAVVATESQRLKHTAEQERVVAKKTQIEKFTEAAKQRLCDEASEKKFDEKLLDDSTRSTLQALRQELEKLESAVPELPTAMAVTDYEQSTDLRVHIRGSFLSQGDVVTRGFPAVLMSSDVSQARLSDAESGRLQLAQWLVDGRHPLVARVMVNRLWRWHFGRGLVNSTDNFGLLCDRPGDQRLLDWLAVRLVGDGWSIKKMHRLIMLSATYQMSSQHDAANALIDEDNRYHWRASVQRLEAEAIRDAILQVSGRLDPSVGESLLHVKNREFLFDHTSKDETKYDSTLRSVYLPVIRNHLYDAFQLFDFADASVMNSNRTTTTVAPQALFMMNSDLVSDAAVSFADRVCGKSDDNAERISFAYQLALGRPPNDVETARAKRYLNQFREANTEEHGTWPAHQAWVVLCQTIMMSNEFIHVR